MSDTSTPSSYSNLFLVRAFQYFILIFFIDMCIVLGLYTFMWEQPFYEVLAKERGMFASVLTWELMENMRYNGDLVYDVAFVRTGAERAAYGAIEAGAEDAATEAVSNLAVFGTLLDNTFDYLLMLSHRTGFFMVILVYIFILVAAVAFHGAVIRHRKRYAFGETPLLMNIWARTTLAYSIPLTMLIWMLPFALSPYLLIGSLACCVFGVAIFSFSMPKLA